ncbi:hypothetical protein [Catenuloplanes atrovinosus]|uniref:Uncharacterized protein n=1 Tax=Catenuloplanes atrovinosus TaxID=137266 RepID=A0AAE4C999_9ACTN|nr:hypothetical protein [Catenuloplanes atrovinosus]MDR7275833.1 hypothetical protein [Catenuloplanes atrovinosus]
MTGAAPLVGRTPAPDNGSGSGAPGYTWPRRRLAAVAAAIVLLAAASLAWRAGLAPTGDHRADPATSTPPLSTPAPTPAGTGSAPSPAGSAGPSSQPATPTAGSRPTAPAAAPGKTAAPPTPTATPGGRAVAPPGDEVRTALPPSGLRIAIAADGGITQLAGQDGADVQLSRDEFAPLSEGVAPVPGSGRCADVTAWDMTPLDAQPVPHTEQSACVRTEGGVAVRVAFSFWPAGDDGDAECRVRTTVG